MKKNLLTALAIGLILLAMPMKQFGQQPIFHHNEATIDFDITEISLFDERIYFLYNLLNDSHFNVINSEREGVFIISADDAYPTLDLNKAFNEFKNDNATAFAVMGKEEAAELAKTYKTMLPEDFTLSLMMDVYAKSRQNNLCANADPFCTDNGLYQFPAGVNAGSGEPGPNYACLSTTPNPAWYYMRIGTPGGINIYMYSTPSEDIDFCCWGPFDDPISPCPNGLTIQKKVSCSYSANPTETCVIPSNAQTGQYYILVITNYSNHTCNITFSKTSGAGTTDCGIMPPLVNNDGPFCVGDAIHLTANGQAGATYHWTGPNNYSSNQQNPTINNCNMTHTGTYTCTISLNGQTNNASTEVTVYGKPTANFTATTVCAGSPTQFTSTSTTNPSGQNITSYSWDFGDGQTSTQQNPSHTYANAGSHTVSLTVGIGNGTCTSTKTQNVTVAAQPTAQASANQTTVLYGATAQLNGSGGNGSFNYHWEPANMVVNPNAQSTQTMPLSDQQTFTLTVTNPQGNCSDTDEITIYIEGSDMTLSPAANPSVICEGNSTTLNAHAGGGSGNFTYSWSPSTGLNSTTIATPTASPLTTTTYTCTASDGFTTLTGSVTITVNHPEHTEETAYICPGSIFNWHGQSYSDEDDYDFDTLTTQGCEKTITLHLHHYPTYNEGSVTYASICPGDSYTFHGQSYGTTGRYSHTLETVHGCDSIVWLDLTVYPDNGVTEHPWTTCQADLPYLFNGVYFNHEVDTVFTLKDIHDCDSLVRLVLSINQYTILPTEKHYLCYEGDTSPSYTWSVNGHTYNGTDFSWTANGHTYEGTRIIAADTLPYGNCEGIYNLEVYQLKKPALVETSVEACDNYPWEVEGTTVDTYDTSNDYFYSIPIYLVEGELSTRFECDREFTLHLTMHYADAGAQTISGECDEVVFDWFGTPYTFNNNVIYTFGLNDDDHGYTTHGCDSTFTLTVTNMKYTPEPEIVCTDNGVQWPHSPITATEFNVNRYTYAVIDSHTTETYGCEWSISKESWPIIPNGLTCDVFAMDWTSDTIWLDCKVKNICESEGITTRYFLKPSFYDVQAQESYPASVSIFPNPNDGQMRLRFENMEGRLNIKVFNATGILTDEFELNIDQFGETCNYSMQRFSNGVYYFVITDGKRSVTKKVVIIN